MTPEDGEMIRSGLLAAILVFSLGVDASAQNYTLAPDGSYVGGNTSTLAPDGSYVGGWR